MAFRFLVPLVRKYSAPPLLPALVKLPHPERRAFCGHLNGFDRRDRLLGRIRKSQPFRKNYIKKFALLEINHSVVLQ
jgi:hypothetical protein